MDLKNGTITVGEMLKNPSARKLFQQLSPISINSPIIRSAHAMTLNELLRKAKAWVPQERMNEILEALKKA